jgi:hypothetical protein
MTSAWIWAAASSTSGLSAMLRVYAEAAEEMVRRFGTSLTDKNGSEILHRHDAIQHQVHEHLLCLHAIAHSRVEIVPQINTDGYSILCGLPRRHPGDFANDLLYRD